MRIVIDTNIYIDWFNAGRHENRRGGDTLRRLQAAHGFRIDTTHSIVNDVVIALSARSIAATVVAQNERDYQAIQSVSPFQLLIVPQDQRVVG